MLKRFINIFLLVVGVMVALATNANAAAINLVGGTAGAIPGGATNEFIPGLFTGPTIGGYFGSQVGVDVAVPSTLTLEFFGAEAGYHNEFNLGSVRVVRSSRWDHNRTESRVTAEHIQYTHFGHCPSAVQLRHKLEFRFGGKWIESG